MRQILAVPKKPGPEAGIPVGQIKSLLQEGWICIPGVSVQVAQAATIAVPGQPPPSSCDLFDLWLSPPVPMIPMDVIMNVMAGAQDKGGDVFTLETLSQALFGRGMGKLYETVQEGKRATAAAEKAARERAQDMGAIPGREPDEEAIQ